MSKEEVVFEDVVARLLGAQSVERNRASSDLDIAIFTEAIISETTEPTHFFELLTVAIIKESAVRFENVDRQSYKPRAAVP